MSTPTDPPVTAAQVAAGHDLRGRHVLVTGATGPLGRQVARALALADATVLVTDPDPEAATRLATRLRAEVEGSTVLPGQLDPGSIRSCRRLAAAYLATAQPLSVLALCESPPPSPGLRRTVDGFEAGFGVRVGEVALMLGLLPALRQASAARVVTVAATGVTGPVVDLHDPNFLHRPYDPWLAYGQAQTAGCLFASAVTQHYAAEGITCNAADPGWPPLLDPDAMPPDDVAAAPVAWAAMAAQVDALSGRLLTGPDVIRPLPPAVTDVAALDWWALAERLARSVTA